MTPERAREIVRQQSQFPYWGNYQRFMSEEERAFVQARFETHPSGSVTIASIIQRIARADRFEAPPDFDEKDAEIARERLKEWNKRQGPRVGDWIEMTDGTIRRFTHNWGDGLQTTCGSSQLSVANGRERESGSFYFFGSSMSFSGGLDPIVPLAEIEPTGDTRNGRTWFFHHNHSGANRGVYFTVPCRVFRQVKR